MSKLYMVTDKLQLKVVARNFKDGEEINVKLTLLNEDKKELGKKEDKTTVLNHFAKYPFVTEDLAKSLGIEVSEVAYIKGWMDADGDGKIDYGEEVVAKIKCVSDIFVGFIHNSTSNSVHLITQKDLEKYKLHTRNPVTNALEGTHPIIQGAGSVFAGLYGFGDWAARISGFRDWQLDNIEDIEQEESSNETKYTLKLIKYIAFNENGSGELFGKSLKKYIAQNPEYVTSRFLTGTTLSYFSKAPLLIPTVSTTGNVLFTAKEIDDFAKSIVLGK